MRGYYNLSRPEIAFLCAMFSEVKFNRVSITNPITPERLKFVKDKFITGCLKALLKHTKTKLDEKSIRTVERILKKNVLNEVVIEDFEGD